MTRPPLPIASGEPALLARFGAALDAEREALLSGDEEFLTKATREKSLLVDALMALDRQVSPRRASPAARTRLRQLAEQNRLNALLIAERLGEVQRRRQFFERLSGRVGVYGPDGVTLPASAPRLSARI